jgi:hypothetical protein
MALVSLTPARLPDFLLHVAVTRPVFVWGQPGIGKSALVQRFAEMVGIPCVSLLGSQLAPEDIIGVPQVVDGVSRFCPPANIARRQPYCLFLDELNACTHEVQKAFYSLIHERRVGEYTLPEGSVVIGAGNRAQDSAIVRPMSSALMNRMIHVELVASARDWLAWAHGAGVHPWVLTYLERHPHQLCSPPPKSEETFSTPRSWHMLGDALHSYGERIDDDTVRTLAYGCLTPEHAGMFAAHVKNLRMRYSLPAILRGDQPWPGAPQDRDVLYYLARMFRDDMVKTLPAERAELTPGQKEYLHDAKRRLADLAELSEDVAMLVVAESDGVTFPNWLLTDIVRDLPRLAARTRDDAKAR